MKAIRRAAAAGLIMAGIGAATPATAQFYLKAPDFTSAPVSGREAAIMLDLPGAKPEELSAAMVWNLRAGLNVAALQCQFEPTLLTLNQYNYLIGDHAAEFAKSYAALTAYFKRVTKTPKAAQTAIDEYGTRTYSGFSTVQGQLGFCATASKIGRAALFAPKGSMAEIAARRLRELRNSLRPARDEIFGRFVVFNYQASPVPLIPKCWDKKNALKKTCTPLASQVALN